ncbi:MAG: DUF4112 domain-containing protein [Chitinophagales bacterium]|jgi:hypothetical protein|nr:DUF4112 domain-containing protein [Sphingobacteriales bacterium]
MDNSKQEQLESLRKYVELLESKFTIPGTQFKFGIDPILNFIPGLGSYSGLILGFVFVFLAHKKGVSGKVKVLMFRNLILDHILGSLPIAGYVTDFFYKSNEKNMRLLEEHFMEEKHTGSGWKLILIFILISLSILFITVTVFIWMLTKLIAFISQV